MIASSLVVEKESDSFDPLTARQSNVRRGRPPKNRVAPLVASRTSGVANSTEREDGACDVKLARSPKKISIMCGLQRPRNLEVVFTLMKFEAIQHW